jgi:hypothetical protein
MAIEDGGYGQLNWAVLGGKSRAHVVAYELFYGEIPFDPDLERRLDVDHKCHSLDMSCPGGPCIHRRCCNPAHLIIKTMQVNLDAANEPRKRGRFRTHFDCGCEITEANTYLINRKGTRNGKPRSPERRCRRHERARQSAQRQPSSV